MLAWAPETSLPLTDFLFVNLLLNLTLRAVPRFPPLSPLIIHLQSIHPLVPIHPQPSHHMSDHLHRSHRLAPHFTINRNTGDVFATDLDATDQRIYHFPRAQVRLFLEFDQILRTNTWDPLRHPVPGGFSTFGRLWEQDLGNQYGLAHLCDYAEAPSLARGEPIPERLILPATAARVEQQPQPELFQGLLEVVGRTYVRHEKAKERGIAQRLVKKARSEGVASHSAALAKKRSRGRGRGGGPPGFTRASSILTLPDTLPDYLEGAATPFSEFGQDSNLAEQHEQFLAQLNALAPRQENQAGPSLTAHREVIDLTGLSTRDASVVSTTTATTGLGATPEPPTTAPVPPLAVSTATPAPAIVVAAETLPAASTSTVNVAEGSSSSVVDFDVRMNDPDLELIDYD